MAKGCNGETGGGLTDTLWSHNTLVQLPECVSY